MPRPPRLQRRRNRFYLRAAVPQDIQPAVGKTEVIRSLKTGDYREALRRLPLASAEARRVRRGASPYEDLADDLPV